MKTYFNQDLIKSINLWHVLFTVSIVLFLNILFQLIAAPIKTYNNWKGEEQVYSAHKKIDSLRNLVTYKQALSMASTSDSIYMVVSIPDSLLSIYVKGVEIFSTKIIKHSQSAFLSYLNTQILMRQFAQPQKGVLIKSTLVKEPIKIKMAPKNAEEAAKMAIIPDSVSYEPAFISYKTQNGVILKISYENGFWGSFKIGLANKWTKFSVLVRAIFHTEITDYQPEIDLVVDNIDLTSIYRALPGQPLIVIHLE
jgi:hypothetical protein